MFSTIRAFWIWWSKKRSHWGAGLLTAFRHAKQTWRNSALSSRFQFLRWEKLHHSGNCYGWKCWKFLTRSQSLTTVTSGVSLQEENGISMLQQEKNIRTQVEALQKEKTCRMQQLKLLQEQDNDLCDILCSMPYGISPDCVPSLEELENLR